MQNKKYVVTTAILLLASLTVGCGTKTESNNKTAISDVKYFETNDSTISHYTIIKDDDEDDKLVTNSSNNSYSTISESPSDEIGEVTLIGEDTSTEYTLSEDGTVTYGGVTYKNLYTVINLADTKYDKNTLLNFIIKKIDMGSTEVYCEIRRESSNASEEEDISGEPIDDEIASNKTYERAVAKYDSYITWVITLTNLDNRTTANIYGCYEYILINYLGSDVEVDMSQYDSTGSHVYTDEELQTQQPEQTEEVIEDEQQVTDEAVEQTDEQQVEEIESTDDLEDTNNEN
jgi:hypothetical protein